MKIGFIGAGKMGFTLGKHLKLYEEKLADKDGNKLYQIVGYYSKSVASSNCAAKFTDTHYYESIKELVQCCDAIILTVPDGAIGEVVNQLTTLDGLLEGKILCHTSGALSSQIFSGIGNQVYGYSIHPIYAVSSKTESYINFSQAFITIEGHGKYIKQLGDIFTNIGHKVKVISSDNKVKYHSGAVFASNLVIGLFKMATDILGQCGFSEEEAMMALKPLFINNSKKLYESNPEEAMTGPIERGDDYTINKHLQTLDERYKTVYKILSRELVDIASKKNEKDYDRILELLEEM